MLRLIFALLFVVISFSSFFLNAHASRKPNIGTEIGRFAPSIQLADLSGNPVSLEELRGSVVLLNFWSTFCAPCKAEMPSMNRLHLALQEKDFRVLSVAVDKTDEPIREFVAKNSIAFPVLHDPKRIVFLKEYSGKSLPATYLIDEDGMIVERFSGPQVWDAPEMKNRVLMLLHQ